MPLHSLLWWQATGAARLPRNGPPVFLPHACLTLGLAPSAPWPTNRPQEREAELGCARRDLQAAQEEAGSWQRRCKSLQGEADGRELELARRDLQAKVGG